MVYYKKQDYYGVIDYEWTALIRAKDEEDAKQIGKRIYRTEPENDDYSIFKITDITSFVDDKTNECEEIESTAPIW